MNNDNTLIYFICLIIALIRIFYDFTPPNINIIWYINLQIYETQTFNRRQYIIHIVYSN